MNKSSGFTIVELLITIVVIAILASISTFAYNGLQNRARDSERDSDVRILKNSLEMYRMDNGEYPPACGAGNDNSGCGGDTLIPFLVPKYVSKLPFDEGHNFFEYNYVRGGDRNSYGLLVLYETKPQCKAGTKGTNFWGSSVPEC